MTDHQKTLRDLLARGYFPHSRNGAINDFTCHAADDEFRAAAQAVHDRLQSLEANLGCPLAMRDHAASEQLKFLRAALAATPKPNGSA